MPALCSTRQSLIFFIFALIPAYLSANPVAKTYQPNIKNNKTASPLADQLISPILPKTIQIPSGCFEMGSPPFEMDRNTNERRHRVCVKRFQMSENEVTVSEFKAFVKATHYISDAEINYQKPGCWTFDETQHKHWNWQPWADWMTPLKRKTDDKEPVTCVSYYDVSQYIEWLNKASGQTFRLPTEAEWEYAARAGSNVRYFWGNNPDLACRYANTADLSDYLSLKWPETHRCHDNFFFVAPVKRYLPNKFGLYDMLGNAWEWTCSEYKAQYLGQELQCTNDKLGSAFIAVRGGGWNAGPGRMRLAYRNWESPWARLSTWGFRLVKVKNYSLKSRKRVNIKRKGFLK